MCEIPKENASFIGRAGARGANAKKNVKKSVVAKPNTIKSLFMNSNVKRPAEVRWLSCSFISSVNPTLCLILHVFSQKDVDLSKDDLLGDILQDLHSEVGSFFIFFILLF